MNRMNIIVSVMHPDGHFTLVEVPTDHRLRIDGSGVVTLKDMSHIQNDDSEVKFDTDLPTHLRLFAHPFTGLDVGPNDRKVLAHAADLIEQMQNDG